MIVKRIIANRYELHVYSNNDVQCTLFKYSHDIYTYCLAHNANGFVRISGMEHIVLQVCDTVR